MSLYERVCDVLEQNDRKKRIKAISSIVYSVRKDTTERFSTNEVNNLYSKSIPFLENGCTDTYGCILILVALCGPQDPVQLFESILHETSADPRMFRVEAIRFELLRHNSIVAPDETPLYYDFVSMFPGDDKAYRKGSVILTNKRILMFGAHNGPVFHDATVFRLLYSDLENHQYLESIDYLELDRIESVTSEWSWSKKQIVIQYNTRYLKEKGRTIYGPLFFKADLPKKVTVEEGVLPIIIRLDNLHFPDAPKDFLRKRQVELIRRINEARGIIS